MQRYVDLCDTFAATILYPQDAKRFFTECGRYIDRIDSLADEYHFNIYNTHGERHSKTVAGLCGAFLEIIPAFGFTPIERRILCLAGYGHDLGMITGDRRGHARKTQELLTEMWKDLGLMSESETVAIGWVSAMHSSKTDPQDVPDTVAVEHPQGREPVRVKALGAVLRVCDALHCTSDRIPPFEVQQRLGVLPDVQLREYYKHYLFDDVTLACEDHRIRIHLDGWLTHDIPEVRSVLTEACERLSEEIAGVAYLFAPYYAFKETDGRPFSHAVRLAEGSVEPVQSRPATNRVITTERLRGFVGRAAYVEEIGRWLTTTTPAIMVVGGIGGIGKTALLQEVVRHSERPTYLAVTHGGLSPEGLFETLLKLLPPGKQGLVDEFLNGRLSETHPGTDRLDACALMFGDHQVTVCIDDYHELQSDALDKALVGLARRCSRLSFLLASRRVPQFAEDPKTAIRLISLQGMELAEVRDLLQMLGVSDELLANASAVQTIWERAGRGHPLAVVIFVNLLGQVSSKTLKEVVELLPEYSDEVWEQWIEQLLHTLDDHERSILDVLSVIRVPASQTMLAGMLPTADLDARVRSLQRKFLVQRLPNRLMALHPLLSVHLYDHLSDDKRRSLHHLAAAHLVPPGSDGARHRILPLENYEMAFHHAHAAGESNRMASLAQKMLGDLFLQGRVETAEKVCALVERIVGEDKKASWFLIRKARLLSLKGDHDGCQRLLNRVGAQGPTRSTAAEALQIRALDFISQGRGSEAFSLLKEHFKIARHQKTAARLAVTALKCLPGDIPLLDVVRQIDEVRSLDAEGSVHVARCDLLAGAALLKNHEPLKAYERFLSAVDILRGFSRDDAVRCVEGLVECCEALGGRSEERDMWRQQLADEQHWGSAQPVE